jgi:hypothetical protein
MYFSEPTTDFRTRLYADDGQGVDIDFNVHSGTWHVKTDPGVSRETLRLLVRHLHDQFYRGEHPWLDDWLQLVDEANTDRPRTLALKTVDRLATRGNTAAQDQAIGSMPQTRPAGDGGSTGDVRRGNRQDQRSIDVEDQQELRHWAQQFHATEDDVKAAVARVDTEVRAVGDFLQSGRRPQRGTGAAGAR